MSRVLTGAFEQFPILVLTGPRLAGKTFLVRLLFNRARYVTFEIPRDAEMARLDVEAFLSRFLDPLIIDEVQYVPEVSRQLKISVDRFLRATALRAGRLISYSEIARAVKI